MTKKTREPAQRDGVQGEEVGGQQPSGLSPQERLPTGVCSPWCWSESGSGQDSADRSGAQAVAEPGEFAVEAAVAPGRVLVCQAQDQVAELIADWWAARLAGVGPFSGDQAAVPGQQRSRGDDAMLTQWAGEQTGQSGQDRPLRPGGSRSTDLTAQDHDFMAQDQDPEVLGRSTASEQPQPTEHRDTDQVQQSEQHSR
jgi:hypothetical protein